MESFIPALATKLFVSLAIIATTTLASHLIIKRIRKNSEFLDEHQRRWISTTKNIAVLLAMVSIILVWWPELKEFALSIAAIAVALVIASKELILCLSGTIFRTASRPFAIGDWIEVGNLRGEVIDQSPLSTKIQEIYNAPDRYDYTGRTVVIPNSQFLSTPVKNMNFIRRFVFHSFTLTTEPNINLFAARQPMLEKIEHYSEEFIEVAQRYNALIEKRAGIDIASAEANISISTSNLGKNQFNITIFCPTNQAHDIEQKVTEDFFSWYYQKLEEKEVKDKLNNSDDKTASQGTEA